MSTQTETKPQETTTPKRGRPRLYKTPEEAKEARKKQQKEYNQSQKHKEYQKLYKQKQREEYQRLKEENERLRNGGINPTSVTPVNNIHNLPLPEVAFQQTPYAPTPIYTSPIMLPLPSTLPYVSLRKSGELPNVSKLSLI